jgi:hypothetical protein
MTGKVRAETGFSAAFSCKGWGVRWFSCKAWRERVLRKTDQRVKYI